MHPPISGLAMALHRGLHGRAPNEHVAPAKEATDIQAGDETQNGGLVMQRFGAGGSIWRSSYASLRSN